MNATELREVAIAASLERAHSVMAKMAARGNMETLLVLDSGSVADVRSALEKQGYSCKGAEEPGVRVTELLVAWGSNPR